MTVEDIIRKLEVLVADETENHDVNLKQDSTADDIAGWDSVAHSRIMMRVEETFAIVIEDDKMFSFKSVGELACYIGVQTAELVDTRVSELAVGPIERSPVDAIIAAKTLPQEENPNEGELISSAQRAPIFNLFSDARYPAPYMMFRSRPPVAGPSSTDANGFLNKFAPNLPKARGERRVFVVGNSVIRGGHIVSWLQDKIVALGRDDVKIFNFGVISANCYQMLMYMLWQGLDLQPDLVILYDGYSDVALPIGYDARPGFPYNQHMLEIVHEHLGEGRISELDFVREETKRRNEVRALAGWKTPAWEAEISMSYANCIRKWHKVCEAYGVPLVTILQSSLAFKLVREGIEVKRSPAYLVDHVQRCYAMIRNELQQMRLDFPGSGHGFVDLSRLFADDVEQCYVDMVHPVKHKYPDVSQRIYDEIKLHLDIL